MRVLHGFAMLAGWFGIICGAVPAAADDARIHYHDCAGLICLDVPLGGHREIFLLDTGNASSTIELGLARQLGLALAPATRRNHPDEVLPGVFKTALPDAVASGLGLGNPAIAALDLGDFRKDLGMKIAGSLAYTAFKDRVLRLDPRQHVVTVGDASPGPAPAGAQRYGLRIVTFGSAGPPILTADAVEVNGHKFLAQLDTVFPEGAMLFPASRDTLGLQDAHPIGHRILPYYDDHAELLRLAPGKVTFGDPLFAEAGRHVFLPGKGVHFPDNDIALVLGNAWFQGRLVTFDLHEMTVTIAPLA